MNNIIKEHFRRLHNWNKGKLGVLKMVPYYPHHGGVDDYDERKLKDKIEILGVFDNIESIIETVERAENFGFPENSWQPQVDYFELNRKTY